MNNIPQIVRERLKAGAVVSGHPDADILTAFGERTLPKPERAGMLAHLAACADCREIVALALPATGSIEAASFVVRRPWFTWPAFRWGFVTAGVALIALGVVEFERHQPVDSAAIVAKQITAAQPMAGDVQSQLPSQNSSVIPKAARQPGTVSHGATLAKKDIPKLTEPELRVRRAPGESQLRIPARVAPPSPELEAKRESAKGSVSIPPSSQVIEVQAQNEMVSPRTSEARVAQAAPAGQFLAYDSGPLTRAKPANTPPSQVDAADAVLATPRWSITAVGGLQRSFDQGKTWQDVSVEPSAMPESFGPGAVVTGPPIKRGDVESSGRAKALKVYATPVFFRAITAAGNEVWAGGSNAALFHSIDGGNHWTRVLLSSSGVALTGDVVSVEFSDPQHGTVTTSTPEIWITNDDGQSWQKQ